MSSSLFKKTLQRRSATPIFKSFSTNKSFSKRSFHSSPFLSKKPTNQHSSGEKQKDQKSQETPTTTSTSNKEPEEPTVIDGKLLASIYSRSLKKGAVGDVNKCLAIYPQFSLSTFVSEGSNLEELQISPLMHCAITGRWRMMQEILQALPKAFAAIIAERVGIGKSVSELVKEHVNLKLNQPQHNALHQAIWSAVTRAYYQKAEPPHIANYYNCVELLVNHPATDLNCLVEPNKQTPLKMASMYGLTSIVDLLLRNGATIEIADFFSDTPLHAAVRDGNIDTAVLLVAHAVANNNLKFLTAVNRNGQTFMDIIEKPVRTANEVDHLITMQCFGQRNQNSLRLLAETVKDLISRSANGSLPIAVVEATRKVWNGHEGGEEVQDFIGNTSLMVAAFRGDLETVKKLAAASKLLKKNKLGWNALHWSLIHSGPRLSYSSDVRMEIVKVLMPKTNMDECTTVDDSNVLQMSFPNPDIVRLLLETKFVKDINAKTPARGFSAFHLLIEAVNYSRMDDASITQSAEILAQHGASPNERSLKTNNLKDITPAMLATMTNQVPILQVLVERCGMNLVDKEYSMENPDNPLSSPFLAACQFGKFDVVFYLMERYYLSPNVLIKRVGSLIALAIMNARQEHPLRVLEVVKTLVEKFNADVNYCDKSSLPPLFWACSHQTPIQIAEYLLQHGADPTVVDFMGRTINQHLTESRDAVIRDTLMSGNPHAVDSVKQKYQQLADLIQRYINQVNQQKMDPLNPPQLIMLHEAIVSAVYSMHVPNATNYYERVQLLVNSPATDLNHLSEPERQTPVQLASMYGLTSIVDLLLQKGASVDIADPHNQTPLHLAVESAYIDTAVVLVAHAVANNNLKFLTAANHNGQTFLNVLEKCAEETMYSHRSAQFQRHQNSVKLLAEVVKDLIGRSANGSLPADVVEATRKVWNGHEGGEEVQDFIGNTSLMVAAFRGDLEAVKKLAATSTQLKKNKFGWNALYWSLVHSAPRFSYSRDVRKQIVKLLLPLTNMEESTTVDDTNVLQMSFPNPDFVRLLIDTNFVKDINAKTPQYGLSAFHLLIGAARQYRIDDLSLSRNAAILVQHGALTNQRNISGITPTMLACVENQLPIIKFFIERCGMNLTDKEHMLDPENPSTTPFMLAFRICGWEVAFYLMEKYNLSPNAMMDETESLLSAAVTNNHQDTLPRRLQAVKDLVDKFKADVNFRGDKTSTAIARACAYGAPKEIIEFLLQRGADPTILDAQGMSTIQLMTIVRDAIVEMKVAAGESAESVDLVHQQFKETVDLIQPYIDHYNQKRMMEHYNIKESRNLFGDVPQVVDE